MNEERQTIDDNSLRRRADQILNDRFTMLLGNMERFRETSERAIRLVAESHEKQSAMLLSLIELSTKFSDHDKRETEDRDRSMAVIEGMMKMLIEHGNDINTHSEAIVSLKQWNLLIAGAIGALASSGTVWIIQHLQSTLS